MKSSINTAPPKLSGVPTVRCAIYTRKSSEQGLEQEFNSLHAQRESAEAYIASMKHEGWVALPDQYNDGGFTLTQSAHRHTRLTDLSNRYVSWLDPLGQMHALLMLALYGHAARVGGAEADAPATRQSNAMVAIAVIMPAPADTASMMAISIVSVTAGPQKLAA